MVILSRMWALRVTSPNPSWLVWARCSTAGRSQAERESFGRLLLGPEQCGLVDAFRARHPGVTAYTYWDHKTRARERGVGWRLDYCLVRPAQLAARPPCDACMISWLCASSSAQVSH